MKMTISGIIILAILALSLYAPWWFLSPETFWQRFIIAILIELPILFGGGFVGILAWVFINGDDL
tara:strand:+ start:623 stop:817 length:195 start_codon:yes stop_codon:yes gene_type:complete